MRKLTIYAIVLVLLTTAIIIMPTGEPVGANAEDEYLARISPGLSDELEASRGELVSVIVWANSNMTSVLDSMIKSGEVTSYSEFDKFNCYHIMSTPEGVKKLARNRNILRMEENYTLQLPEMNSTIATEGEKHNWGLDVLNISNLWDKGLDGEGVTVGILDSGVDAEHPELAGKIDKFAAFGLSGEIDKDAEPFDLYGHGTHCSGIICGETVGVAPKSHLYVGSVMPTGSGTFAQVIAGMNWILDPDSDPETDDGPSIVSMSLGGAVDQDMVDIADVFERSGVLLIASIGNGGEGSSGTPGNIPSVLGVGAITEDRDIAYSSSGTTIDWQFYPYEETVIKPDVSAPGDLIYSSLPGGKYAQMSGTSMAAPHVAGVSALLKEYDENISNISIRETLEMTAEDLGESGRDTRYGEGIVDPTSAVEYLEQARRVDIDIVGELGDEPIVLSIPERRTYRVNGDTSIYIREGESTHIKLDLFGYEDFEETVSFEQGSIALELVKLPIMTYTGNIISSNGNPAPGWITFKDTPLQIETDESGFFEAEVPVDTYDVEYWGMCCEPMTVTLDMTSAGGTVELQRTDILAITTQGITPSKYQSRRFDTYCYRALNESNISFCPINAEKFDLSLADLQMFDRVYWFGGPNQMSADYSDMLAEYLDSGGKLMLSSSNILMYDGYRGYSNEEPSFVSDYFGVSYIGQGSYTTSLVGLEDTELGDGLLLSLSGGDGATNQIGFDAFDINSTSGMKTNPFLCYLGPANLDDGDIIYAGATVESGRYAGVYLSFGFEVVNNKADRIELLHRIEDWFAGFGSADITFENENGTPVYSIASIDGVLDGIETGDDGHIRLSSLKAGKYSLDVSALGFKKQSFDIEIVSGETKRIRMTLFEPASIKLSGSVVDGNTGEPLECAFKIAGKDVKEYTTDENGAFDLDLPLFDYEIKFYKKRYLSLYFELERDMPLTENEPMTIDLHRYDGRYAVVEQLHPSWVSSSMGGWFFQGLAQNYDKVYGDLGQLPVKLIIPPNGKVNLEDINQFGTIIWITGYNNEIGDDSWTQAVAEYVQGGGKLIIVGNTAPTGIWHNHDLANLLGFELVDDNSWIFTIEGVKDDPIGDGILIAKYHPYTRNGLLTHQPSMRPVNGGVSCFNLVGGESAGVWVKNDNQATVVLGFDMFDIYDDMDTRAEILNRALELIEQ